MSGKKLWFMVDMHRYAITIVFVGFINQLVTGGHHPVCSLTGLVVAAMRLAGRANRSRRKNIQFSAGVGFVKVPRWYILSMTVCKGIFPRKDGMELWNPIYIYTS
jgi:hypothetical protein